MTEQVEVQEEFVPGAGEGNRRGAMVVVGLFLLAPFVVLALYFMSDDDVRQRGLKGEGTIRRMVDTGNRYNRDPEIKIFLEIRVDGREPYNWYATKVLSPLDLQHYKEGARVKLKVDPEDKHRVVIVGVIKDEPPPVQPPS